MTARRALCISRASSSCTAVGGALAATGLAVEHCDAVPEDLSGVALVVVDRSARRATGEALRALHVPVVVVGDDLADDDLIALMLEAPVSHLVEDPADRDLCITSKKLASGDLFGLEKYVAPGAPVGERMVHDDTTKRRTMAEVSVWAESVGARRPLVHRIASVTDELLMNALAAASSSRPAGGGRAPARVRWAADERMLALSVGDGCGTLRQRDVIDHVRRARHERGRPRRERDGGAGIGLYLVLANVACLVVNVEPGQQTEIVCLFDLARSERPAVRGLRALHVFAGV